jgi:glycosyltransferase involved in cell wall biosynthesis
MRSMRILHVIAEMDAGGAERVVHALAETSIARGHAVAVASAPGRWTPRLVSLGVSTFDLPATSRSVRMTLRSVGAIRSAIRAFAPTVIHTHNVRATVAARLATPRRSGRAMVTTLHGLAASDYRTGVRALRLATPHVVACGDSVGRRLAAAGMPADRLSVIRNGVDSASEVDEATRHDTRGRYGMVSRPAVLGIGRLVEQKNWPAFLDVAEATPHADFFIAGDGPLRVELGARAIDNLHFLGTVDDIPALLASVDLFLSTSNWEGLSMALLEALAAGVPVVTTAVDGVGDVLEPDMALMTQPGDVDGLIAAVAAGLGDLALRERLAAAGKAAAGGWTTERMADEYLRAYGRADARP